MTDAATDGASTRRMRVAARRTVGRHIDEFVLVAEDGDELAPFTPGAHIDVHPEPGVVRQYSLCGDPGDRSRYIIAVLHQPQGRGGSRAVHQRLQVGTAIDASLPRQNFPLVEDSPHSLLIAGGVGITPILSMARRLHKLGRSFDLHYRARDGEHAAYASELRESDFQSRVQWHLGERGDLAAETGLANLFQGFDRTRVSGAHVYVCGPAGLMDAILSSARAAGWPESQLHSETFSAAPGLAGGDAFEVTFRKSGKSAVVGAKETIVEAALRIGIEIETSCEQGVCGTCVTPVLSGAVDHRDTFLTDAEHASGQMMTPCCSRAAGKCLVLDA